MNQSSPSYTAAKLSAAVASVVAAASPPVSAQVGVLEEVIVTARKRTESVQDIPASIQALSGEDIREIGARGIADFSRFLSSVEVLSYGNGSSKVIFRGADNGSGFLAQATSSVYVDEISVTALGDQPSVRMVDIERVEALAGPQGTIYGSDAQAGTLRIITNKPVMNEFQAVLDLSARDGSDSDGSWDGSIVLNLPILEDKLALRLVGFGATDGGYVDNVFGHTADTSVVQGPGSWPSGFGTLDNSKTVKDNWNDSDISGWRATLKWDINEDWSATLGALHQKTDSNADNFQDPYAGDLEVVQFFDSWRDDEYDLYSLTVEADLGFAQLVSATAYYDRDYDTEYDLTTYHHYWAGHNVYCQNYDLDPSTYYWYYANPDGSGVLFWPVYCAAPTVEGDYLATNFEPNQQDRFSQEIRLSASGETLDWLVGLFYEDASSSYQSSFGRPITNDFQDSIAAGYWEWAMDDTFPQGRETWYEDSDTDWEQTAVFGEVVWHINGKLDLTLGGRYFEYDNDNKFEVERPRGNLDPETSVTNRQDGDEFAPKVALSYHFTDDVMAYALWSQGYRMGGANRRRGDPFFEQFYDPDKMTNYELGIRSTLFSSAVRANLTAFYMDWEDYQLDLVDPSSDACPDLGDVIPQVCGQPWQIMLVNAGDAHIAGASGELDWAATSYLTFGLRAEYLEAENDSDVQFLDFSVEDGQELPNTPDWTGSAFANLEWPIDRFGEVLYARLQWSYRGSSNNIFEPIPADGSSPNPQLKVDSSDIGDASLGMRGGDWDVSLFVNNITDERAVSTIDSGNMEWGAASVADGRAHTQRNYINRPREFGVRFIMRWGG
jgi:outer membrane receptor protein involved in Fe transport